MASSSHQVSVCVRIRPPGAGKVTSATSSAAVRVDPATNTLLAGAKPITFPRLVCTGSDQVRFVVIGVLNCRLIRRSLLVYCSSCAFSS